MVDIFPYSVYTKQGQSVAQLPAGREVLSREPNICSATQEIHAFYGT